MDLKRRIEKLEKARQSQNERPLPTEKHPLFTWAPNGVPEVLTEEEWMAIYGPGATSPPEEDKKRR